MKPNLLTTGILLMALVLSVSSCGKKPESARPKLKQGDGLSESRESEEVMRQLEWAVRVNRGVDFITDLIHRNRSMNLLNRFTKDRDTLLNIAIRNNYPSVRDLLIREGASLTLKSEHKDTRGMTPLMVGAYFGHDHSVKAILDHIRERNDEKSSNRLLDEQDASGSTALHLALRRKFESIALYLIKEGADLDLKDEQGRNAYDLAVLYDGRETAKFIEGMMKAAEGSLDIATFRSVIVNGDIDSLRRLLMSRPSMVKEYEVVNPLALTLDVKEEQVAFAMAQMLLAYQASVEGPVGAEITPLMKAVRLNKFLFAQLFLQNNADVQQRDDQHKNLLYHAIENNNYNIVDLLMSYDVEQKYEVGRFRNRFKFQACTLATSRPLDETNYEIRKRLGCWVGDRFFRPEDGNQK